MRERPRAAGMRRGLPPFAGPSPRILILGSFPSEASLARGEYYGFGRNQFWRLAAAAVGAPLPGSWLEKTAFLSGAGIALWDAAAACAREGSLDQAIRDASPNPVPDFVLARPSIRRIVLNGTKAAELFARFFGADGPIPLAPARPLPWLVPGADGLSAELLRVPSSSPVPSREFRSAEEKLSAWRAALHGA